MTIIMLGAPGTGKGTVAGILSEKLDIPQVSTGDIFRKNIKEQTELGKLANEYISKGNLVPDEVTIDIVKDRLKQDDVQKGIILDGFPRTVKLISARWRFFWPASIWAFSRWRRLGRAAALRRSGTDC